MKILVLIARLLLGLMFLVFGSNGFLHFIPMKGDMPPTAIAFMGAMASSHFILAGFVLQIFCGLLLLSGLYIPLALTLIGPVLGFILLFHATMAPAGIVPGLVATLLWFVVFAGVRSAFAGIFAPKVAA
jgi:uncharacterized membrane protein YphA (DoxX/SURF4 family)